MARGLLRPVAVLLSLALTLAAAVTCPPPDFSTVQGFDLDSFISKRWYIQQQMEVQYLPKSQNFCVYAEYSKKSKPGFWGYEIAVHNHAEEADGTVHDPGSDFLCAKVVDSSRGKLEVAPCFLPTLFSGPYWVLAYEETAGFALISGGAPSVAAPGGCRTGTGVNGAGLWIFTRDQQPNQAVVQKARDIATQKGFDISVLNAVDHSNCSPKEARVEERVVV